MSGSCIIGNLLIKEWRLCDCFSDFSLKLPVEWNWSCLIFPPRKCEKVEQLRRQRRFPNLDWCTEKCSSSLFCQIITCRFWTNLCKASSVISAESSNCICSFLDCKYKSKSENHNFLWVVSKIKLANLRLVQVSGIELKLLRLLNSASVNKLLRGILTASHLNVHLPNLITTLVAIRLITWRGIEWVADACGPGDKTQSPWVANQGPTREPGPSPQAGPSVATFGLGQPRDHVIWLFLPPQSNYCF